MPQMQFAFSTKLARDLSYQLGLFSFPIFVPTTVWSDEAEWNTITRLKWFGKILLDSQRTINSSSSFSSVNSLIWFYSIEAFFATFKVKSCFLVARRGKKFENKLTRKSFPILNRDGILYHFFHLFFPRNAILSFISFHVWFVVKEMFLRFKFCQNEMKCCCWTFFKWRSGKMCLALSWWWWWCHKLALGTSQACVEDVTS